MLNKFFLRQTKSQIALTVGLGLVILGQIGFVSYRAYNPVRQPVTLADAVSVIGTPVENSTHAGSAKAFGLAIPHEKHFQVSSVNELSQVFKQCNYTLAKAKKNGKVPP